MEFTIAQKYKLKTWYDFDLWVFEAVCDFINKLNREPVIIAINKHTYSQICFILSISRKHLLYRDKKEECEPEFEFIEILYTPNEDMRDLAGFDEHKHYKDPELQELAERKLKILAMQKELEETKGSLFADGTWTINNQLTLRFFDECLCDDRILTINNPFAKGYSKFEDRLPHLLACVIDEDKKDKEFELIWVDIDDYDDDDDNDFDDEEIPVLPVGGKVKEKELVPALV